MSEQLKTRYGSDDPRKTELKRNQRYGAFLQVFYISTVTQILLLKGSLIILDPAPGSARLVENLHFEPKRHLSSFPSDTPETENFSGAPLAWFPQVQVLASAADRKHVEGKKRDTLIGLAVVKGI